MIFENCANTKRMGDIGEARALYEFIKKGIDVFLPANEFQKADLVINYEGLFFSIQVKTTKTKGASNNYIAQLRTTGKNSSAVSISNRKDGDYNFLFVLTNEDDWYLIPEAKLPKTAVTLNSTYDTYKNNFDILYN